MKGGKRAFNGEYRGEYLNRVAFPMGGIGAGMIALEGTGALSHVSLRHKPDVHNEPLAFAALFVKGTRTARVLEGPVPMWKAFGSAGPGGFANAGNGLGGRGYGLPRFGNGCFTARFPFGVVKLADRQMPVRAELTGWSPFIPGQADDSSLPVAGLEYRLVNRSKRAVEGVFSFHAANFMKVGDGKTASVAAMDGGFVLSQAPGAEKPWEEGHLAAYTTDPAARVDGGWFRGGWFDPLTMVWKNVNSGAVVSHAAHAEGAPSGGGSFYVPFKLKAGQARTVRVLLAWFVPLSELRNGADLPAPATACGEGCACGDTSPAARNYRPWYATRFKGIADVAAYWRAEYERLRAASQAFSDCFYDTTLPPEVVEAVAANLTILKSPTSLRQADGRFWGWEGCHDASGCCHGTCTHVWNYAQALPHLFPSLERSLRDTEFVVSQDEKGHQTFRTSLPIRPPDHNFHAAADGQLGGIMKLHREWRISGDTAWMKSLWPRARASLDYCIAVWDPDHTGTLVEPHHNTYDIEFWGPDGMCTSFYLGALAAAAAMGAACGEDTALYRALAEKGKRVMESALWNGEYFFQKVVWQGLRAGDPTDMQVGMARDYSAEARELLRREGPKYQYGTGCLSDGVLGDWIARCCGVTPVVEAKKIARHLASVFKYNFRPDLSDHANPQRPGYAFPRESGLLLCTWPKGGALSLPFPYSNEVWTGFEYQVASHLMMMGSVREGRAIVRAARQRYDGRYRNPFNEYECGHWYARAMSSYGLLQALSGARYDAVEKTLYVRPAVRGDFRAFLCTATGYGTIGMKKGQPFLRVRAGTIDVRAMVVER